jgi:SAM-dependent methyltransferase
VLAFMPAQQGVTRWPRKGPNLTSLVEEIDLPLPDRSIDRVLLVHAVESTEQVRPMLREIWRVMADGGRLVVVAPTRAGLWSQMDRSPFYHGHPYSPGQLAACCARTCSRRCARPRSAVHAAGALAAGAAHGARRRALRPALARPLRRCQRHRIGQSNSMPASPSAPPAHELAVVRPKLRIAKLARHQRNAQRRGRRSPRLLTPSIRMSLSSARHRAAGLW